MPTVSISHISMQPNKNSITKGRGIRTSRIFFFFFETTHDKAQLKQ